MTTPTLSDALPIIRSAARSVHRAQRGRIALEDLEQEGVIEALVRLPDYDPSRGNLNTYLYPRVRGAMVDHLRETWWTGSSAFRQLQGRGVLYLPQRYRYGESGSPIPEPTALGPEHADPPEVEFAAFVRSLWPGVTLRQLAALTDYFVHGLTMKQIGERVGLSEPSVSQLISGSLRSMNPATRMLPSVQNEYQTFRAKLRTASMTRPDTHAHLTCGSPVTLDAPDDPHVHECRATVHELHDWGAVVLVQREVRPYDAPNHKPRWRALWSEMVPVSSNGAAIAVAQGYAPDQCPQCHSYRMKRSGVCLVCTECGSTSGCG